MSGDRKYADPEKVFLGPFDKARIFHFAYDVAVYFSCFVFGEDFSSHWFPVRIEHEIGDICTIGNREIIICFYRVGIVVFEDLGYAGSGNVVGNDSADIG